MNEGFFFKKSSNKVGDLFLSIQNYSFKKSLYFLFDKINEIDLKF